MESRRRWGLGSLYVGLALYAACQAVLWPLEFAYLQRRFPPRRFGGLVALVTLSQAAVGILAYPVLSPNPFPDGDWRWPVLVSAAPSLLFAYLSPCAEARAEAKEEEEKEFPAVGAGAGAGAGVDWGGEAGGRAARAAEEGGAGGRAGGIGGDDVRVGGVRSEIPTNGTTIVAATAAVAGDLRGSGDGDAGRHPQKRRQRRKKKQAKGKSRNNQQQGRQLLLHDDDGSEGSQ